MVDLNLRRTLFGGNDIAIDLGTANTLIYVKGVGVVVDEPTLLAINKSDKSIITIGREAKKLIGRVPDTIELVRPLRDGVISEIEMAEELVKTLLSRAIGRAYSRPRIVICVPNGVTSVEQRSIETAAHATGASEVFTIEEPMAAAIGSGLNIFEPYGNMIVDIGGGTTEIAVISMEDTAEMQTESMLEIGDKIRDEMGQDMSDQFINTVKPALGDLFGALESTRDALTGGVAILTGEGAPDTMGDEVPADDDMDMEPTVDADAEAEAPEGDEDEFGTADASAGGDEPTDRAKRESVELSKRLGLLLADSKKKD